MLAESYKDAEVLEHFTQDGKQYARVSIKCDRCSGRGIYVIGVHNGSLVPSPHDAGMCWKCLGTGHFTKDVRDYTEAEYESMQKARATQKARRKEAAERREAARIDRENTYTLTSHGFKDSTAYAIVGDSYSIKDELKAHGAKFSYELRWICPEEPTWLPADRYVAINAQDIFELSGEFIRVKETAHEYIASLQPTTGKHLGAVGQRIKVTATVVKVLTFKHEYMRGWPSLSYMHIMKTDEGDTVTWTTSTVTWEVATKHTFVGTVKKLDTYNGDCRTTMTRCKEVQNGSV